MNIAVIKTGGKQYKVSQGQTLNVEKLNVKVGGALGLETLLVSDKETLVGRPSLGERVQAKVLEHGKAKKVSVVKFKNKTHYKKNVGHRQPFTKIQIESIA